jgi:uncharacterized protein
MANNTNQNQSGGNFANDREKASEAGRKGGQQSHSGGSSSDESKGSKSGGNFANDREKASEAGRKGGQN